MTIAPLGREATLEDFWNVEERAEFIDGEIIPVTPGHRPARSSARIWRSLDDYEASHSAGFAVSEGTLYVLRTPRTQILSPDASWWNGDSVQPGPIEGVPVFAAEVRSLSDYGPAAERTMARKRAHYFAGGTQVVWDVDVLREGWIRACHAGNPEHPSSSVAARWPTRSRHCPAGGSKWTSCSGEG